MALIIAQGIKGLCSLSLCTLILLLIKEPVGRGAAACLGQGPCGPGEHPAAVPLEGSVALMPARRARGSASPPLCHGERGRCGGARGLAGLLRVRLLGGAPGGKGS